MSAAPLLLALAAAPLLTGSCGGEETQSKAAWIEQADGICAAGSDAPLAKANRHADQLGLTDCGG